MSVVTDSGAAGEAPPAPRQGKRERLIAAARDLVYRKGVARTTLADIAQASGVPVGNLYYYFKTKDEIVAAIAHAHADQLSSGLADIERRHRSPRARLRALVAVLAGQREMIARHGCPYGTLGSELARQAEGADPLAALLMRIPLDWAEQQFRDMGRRDARDLAAELVAACQGSALLASTLGEPGLMARQARRLERWIDTLAASPATPGSRAGEKG